MKYQRAPGNAGAAEDRPVVVVAGWMGAKEKQLKPYLEFYHKRNIDTIYFSVGPHHVLFPQKGLDQMNAILKTISSENPLPKVPSKVIFHHFSVGGFLFGQMIMNMQKNKELEQKIIPNIKAQIFDSPPDFKNISKGVSRSMGIGGIMETLVERSVRLYLSVTHNTSGVLHRESSAAFHGNSIPAPSLWFYSKADPVADWQDCVTVIDQWKAKGTEVEECVWEDTPHIQHARYDPDRYFGTLAKFLDRNQL